MMSRVLDDGQSYLRNRSATHDGPGRQCSRQIGVTFSG